MPVVIVSLRPKGLPIAEGQENPWKEGQENPWKEGQENPWKEDD